MGQEFAGEGGYEVMQVSVILNIPELVDLDAARLANVGEVVSFEVDEHVVLGGFLGVIEQLGTLLFFGKFWISGNGAADGLGQNVFAFFVNDGFG